MKLPPLPNMKGFKGVDGAGGLRTGSLEIFSSMLDRSLTWKDVEWLRSFAKVPLLVKGVLNREDADLAVKSGVAGIIVSNHGGRNLDTVPATIDALPQVVDKSPGACRYLWMGVFGGGPTCSKRWRWARMRFSSDGRTLWTGCGGGVWRHESSQHLAARISDGDGANRQAEHWQYRPLSNLGLSGAQNRCRRVLGFVQSRAHSQ